MKEQISNNSGVEFASRCRLWGHFFTFTGDGFNPVDVSTGTSDYDSLQRKKKGTSDLTWLNEKKRKRKN